MRATATLKSLNYCFTLNFLFFVEKKILTFFNEQEKRIET